MAGGSSPPPEGTPAGLGAADQLIHLETGTWETGAQVEAVWCTLHQSPPLLPA